MKWLDPVIAGQFHAANTDAYWIAHGGGARIERFGAGAIISHSGESIPAGIVADLDGWCADAGIEALSICARRLVTGPRASDVPNAVRGSFCRGMARENGLCHEVDLLSGYSCGLFPDQRSNRAWLREIRPRRLLNTFAYTCAFSIAAASAGAETLSVDLAKPALERGRHNFALNGLSVDGHRFLSDDVLDVLPRLARRGEKFDAIILDPPTFSRGHRGRIFRVGEDISRLLDLALACAAPGAWILLSTNCSSLSLSDLRSIAEPFAGETHSAGPLPDIPAGDSATTLWMRCRRDRA